MGLYQTWHQIQLLPLRDPPVEQPRQPRIGVTYLTAKAPHRSCDQIYTLAILHCQSYLASVSPKSLTAHEDDPVSHRRSADLDTTKVPVYRRLILLQISEESPRTKVTLLHLAPCSTAIALSATARLWETTLHLRHRRWPSVRTLCLRLAWRVQPNLPERRAHLR